MKGTTHLATGIAVALAMKSTPSNLFLIGLGSLLPDIDIKTSKLGKYNPFADLMQHRGVTHSLIFLIPIFLISKPIGIGIITHLILDALNPAGVKLFFPFNNKIHIETIIPIRSGGYFDTFLSIVMVILCCFLILGKQI